MTEGAGERPGGVGIVVVSHSRALADAAVALAREMAPPQAVRIEVAAGLDETTFGTDATAILAAVEAADSGAGVVVLMDLGSAVLSAELALEMLDPDLVERVELCSAPLVEGLVVAAVTAAGGAPRGQVAAEAAGALSAKQAQVGDAAAPAGAGEPAGAEKSDGAGTAVPEGATAELARFTVRNPHGLHARPAALLVRTAGALDAPVELRNLTTGSGWVAATSLTRVAGLAALNGHEVEVRATGPAGGEAVAAVLALAADGFGEDVRGDAESSGRTADDSVDAAAAPAGEATPPGRAVPASPGIAVGTVWLPDAGTVDADVDRPGDAGEQERRLDAALQRVRDELARLRDRTALTAGADEAGIFDAHRALLDDPDFLSRVRQQIGAGRSDAQAWQQVVDEVAAEWDALPDPYLRARAADVRAVGDSVLRTLLGTPQESLPRPAAGAAGPPTAVVVARDLTPAQVADLDPAAVAGIVLAGSSSTSHAIIIARARGVPAVVGAGEDVLAVAAGTPVALDGATGRLEIDPAADVLTALRRRAGEQAGAAAAARTRSRRPAVTRDGRQVAVAANIAGVQDAAAAADAGADLAGLVRTELLLGERASPPDVAEQTAVYLAVAEALEGRRIVLRTLDVGGDKPLPWVPVPHEDNPFLGLRGLRLSLDRPELFATQLRAVVRAAHETPVSVMFPMVSTLAELRSAREALDAAVRDEGRGTPDGLEVGIMVEVPSAALKAATLAPYVDFFSIGTNDLTQYALAAERGNPAVARLGDALDPGVLQLVGLVCAAAATAPRPTSVAVCGELAADLAAVPVLLGLGVGELSVSPAAVPAVKDAVRATDRDAAGAVAARSTGLPDAAAVRAFLADLQDDRTSAAAAVSHVG